MVVEVLLFCNHTTCTPKCKPVRLTAKVLPKFSHAPCSCTTEFHFGWSLDFDRATKASWWSFFSLSQPCCRCAAVLGLIVLLHDTVLGKLKPQTSMNWSSIVKTSGHKFICNYARDWKTSDSKLQVISTSRDLQGTDFICVFHTVLLHVGIVLLNNDTV